MSYKLKENNILWKPLWYSSMCNKKDITTCGDCSKLENCPIVWMIHKNNPEALNNLKNKQKEL